MNFDPSVFGSIARVAVFSAQGDAEGLASVNGEALEVNFTSVADGIGQLRNLPILTVTVPVLAAAAIGTTTPVTLDANQSPWLDSNRNAYAVSVLPGSVTVGGSLSIQNVVPGGGLLSAGARVRINGAGFTRCTHRQRERNGSGYGVWTLGSQSDRARVRPRAQALRIH